MPHKYKAAEQFVIRHTHLAPDVMSQFITYAGEKHTLVTLLFTRAFHLKKCSEFNAIVGNDSASWLILCIIKMFQQVNSKLSLSSLMFTQDIWIWNYQHISASYPCHSSHRCSWSCNEFVSVVFSPSANTSWLSIFVRPWVWLSRRACLISRCPRCSAARPQPTPRYV